MHTFGEESEFKSCTQAIRVLEFFWAGKLLCLKENRTDNDFGFKSIIVHFFSIFHLILFKPNIQPI